MTAGEGIRRIRRLFDHAEPTRTQCQMSELVGELVPALQTLARAAHVSLNVDVQARSPEVNVDRLRIQLVLFTTKAGGTGLGLASSRASMEADEGSIGFQEIKPTGSRFWFRLPIVTS